MRARKICEFQGNPIIANTFHRRYMAEILPIRRKTLYNIVKNKYFTSFIVYKSVNNWPSRVQKTRRTFTSQSISRINICLKYLKHLFRWF